MQYILQFCWRDGASGVEVFYERIGQERCKSACERDSFFSLECKCVLRILLFHMLWHRNKQLADATIAEISIRRSFVP